MTTDLLGAVLDRLRDRAAAATDPEVTVGERVLLVEVDHPEDGRLAGLAHRPRGDAGLSDWSSVEQLVELATDSGSRLERAVGIATLNALSVPEIDWRTGDPMATLGTDVDVVATVGLFRPAFRKFDDVEVRVVERDPPESVDAPAGVSVRTYPQEAAREAFDGADVCFVTGSTLIYGGIDRYLSALAAAGVSPVVLVGATASHVPEPAFAAGVDVVAGALVTDVDRVRERVVDGDCGTDLHEAGVEKVYVADATDGDGHGDDDRIPARLGLEPEPEPEPEPETGAQTGSRRNTNDRQ